MSEEEMNQELKADELKDVAGGFLSGCGKAQAKGKDALIPGELPFEADPLIEKIGKKGKNPSVIFPGNDGFDINNDQK